MPKPSASKTSTAPLASAEGSSEGSAEGSSEGSSEGSAEDSSEGEEETPHPYPGLPLTHLGIPEPEEAGVTLLDVTFTDDFGLFKRGESVPAIFLDIDECVLIEFDDAGDETGRQVAFRLAVR